jgi:nucleolar protein 4
MSDNLLQCSEAEFCKALHDLLGKSSIIMDVRIPRESSDAGSRGRGFAFVTFAAPEDVEYAMKTLNGQKFLGRPIAVDWAIPKDKYAVSEQKAEAEEDAAAAADKLPTRPGAAVSGEDGMPNCNDDGEDADSSVEADDNDAEDRKSTESAMDCDSDTEASVDGQSNDMAVVEEPVKTKREFDQEQQERTVFIRNLAFETTDDDLHQM